MTPIGSSTVVGDRYELRERVAKGGMGEVWAATDRTLRRPVAVKLMRDGLVEPASTRTRFQSEARAAASLSHRNVVAVYDSGVHGRTPFIVMELLPGRTLADEIGEGPLDPARVREVGVGILAALSAAHAQGIVHRDVKPSNVLLTDTGSVKVADFGIAKTSGADLTGSGEIVGTAAYMAPERLTGGAASPRSDIYSVGAVLYEALTGRKPFQGESFWGLATAIQEGDRAPVDGSVRKADPELVTAIDRAMAITPSERFGSAEEMAAALEDVSDATAPLSTATLPTDEPTTVEAPEEQAPPEEPTEGRRPRRWVQALVALVVVAAVAVGAWLLLRPEPAATPPAEADQGEETIPPPLEESLDRLEEAVQP
jgi:eukaryotic-like serine/threonine-protein kinase